MKLLRTPRSFSYTSSKKFAFWVCSLVSNSVYSILWHILGTMNRNGIEEEKSGTGELRPTKNVDMKEHDNLQRVRAIS